MRDILEELFTNEPIDPTESARRGLRTQLRKRFYQRATVGEGEAFPVLLDGRAIRTPSGNPLAAPVRPLGEAMAAEWEAQVERIDPATMPLTRLANTIIDGVAIASAPVADEIAQYLGTDLLCYRAGTPEGLVRAQAQHWDPILAWARDAFGARFILSEGIVYVAQPEATLAAARSRIPSDPWRLGAAHVITTLTGSALIALAVNEGALGLEEAWAAANVDEDWNIAQWGEDDEAMQRRAVRFADLKAAATVLALTNP